MIRSYKANYFTLFALMWINIFEEQCKILQNICIYGFMIWARFASLGKWKLIGKVDMAEYWANHVEPLAEAIYNYTAYWVVLSCCCNNTHWHFSKYDKIRLRCRGVKVFQSFATSHLLLNSVSVSVFTVGGFAFSSPNHDSDLRQSFPWTHQTC